MCIFIVLSPEVRRRLPDSNYLANYKTEFCLLNSGCWIYTPDNQLKLMERGNSKMFIRVKDLYMIKKVFLFKKTLTMCNHFSLIIHTVFNCFVRTIFNEKSRRAN
ncbi:MAG: hypothetical protein D8M57_05420 [Candidatus Scalindua sp. AMX11]|nr:MAG: hypothetical protein DWQ00_07365 [Candidatus Scalindua sp.]TDE65979.1 MAG: hypothetical protein D8M57_05420 [Candidatus Scalindua sp. AMX11]